MPFIRYSLNLTAFRGMEKVRQLAKSQVLRCFATMFLRQRLVHATLLINLADLLNLGCTDVLQHGFPSPVKDVMLIGNEMCKFESIF